MSLLPFYLCLPLPFQHLSSPSYVAGGSTEQTSSIWKSKIKRHPAAFLLCLLLFSSSLSPSPQCAILPFSPRVCHCICNRFGRQEGSNCSWWTFQARATTRPPQHLRWHQQQGGAGGHMQPLCSCPDSCCNHHPSPAGCKSLGASRSSGASSAWPPALSQGGLQSHLSAFCSQQTWNF